MKTQQQSILEKDIIKLLTLEEKETFFTIKSKININFYKCSELLYSKLSENKKNRFCVWILKRWFKIDKICNREKESYLKIVHKIKDKVYPEKSINGVDYKILDLNDQGYDGKLIIYKWQIMIHDFYYNQYETEDFKVEPGDVIIDAGAFVGDTALLYAIKTEKNCEIHSFELIEESNILMRENLKLNNISHLVKVNQLALSDKSNETVHINKVAHRAGSTIFGNDNGEPIQTISIDDYISKNNIEKINLIKMDIEGAEQQALIGSTMVIRKHKPKLAICLYHKPSDISEIPETILNIDSSYKFDFKWVELNGGYEAVLFAK